MVEENRLIREELQIWKYKIFQYIFFLLLISL
jgi:hypothetical protein